MFCNTNLISFMGSDKLEDISGKSALIYTVDESDRLVMREIEMIEEVDVEDKEIIEIKTTGRRGDIECTNDYQIKVKFINNDDEEDFEWLSLHDLEKGDKVVALRNSVITYGVGEEVHHTYTIKSIKKKKYSGKMYKLHNIKRLIVNSLIVQK